MPAPVIRFSLRRARAWHGRTFASGGRGRAVVRRRDKGLEREIAAERIRALLAFADAEARAGRKPHADRAVDVARRLAERTQLGYPAELKLRMCRKCHAYVGGTGARRRLTGGRLTVTCLACGKARRRPLAARAARRPGGRKDDGEGAPGA